MNFITYSKLQKNTLNTLNTKTMNNFEHLMTEIGFQILALNDGSIDKDDFVQAVNEIHEHFNTTIT